LPIIPKVNGECSPLPISTGEVAALDLRAPERAAYGRAIQLLSTSNTSLELAAARYAEAVKILGDGARIIEAAKFYAARNPLALPSKPVQALVDELITTKKGRKKSKRYVQDLRSRLDRFAKTFKGNIGDITTAQIQSWLDGLELAPQSYINYRRVVYSLFAFAEARGYIFKGSNPVEAVESVEADDREVEVFTPSEIARLLAEASPDFLPCLAIGCFAGLRSAEIERLEWKDVDLAGRHIVVGADKAKTASRRVVPISDNLAAWLGSCAEKKGKVWKGTHDGFYDAQQETAAATEVKAEPEKGVQAIKAVEWKQNAMRHSYGSYRLALIGDDARVAFEMGDSAKVVHKHYKSLVKHADAAAWFAIMPERPANVAQMSIAA
jgi:integrase